MASPDGSPVTGLDDRLAEREAEVSRLQAELRRLEERVRALLTDLAERDENLRASEGRLQAALADRDAQAGRLLDREKGGAELEAELQTSSARRREAEAQALARERQAARTWQARHQRDVAARDAEIERLRQRVAAAEEKARREYSARGHMLRLKAAPPPQGGRDDLRLIHGVGPVIVERLAGLGVYLFKQVARWSEEDVDWVEARLKHFKGRIRREGWVEAARREHFKKYGEVL
jgi:predicted flap endonuclease-1-like 5' DNA nuclease